MKLRCDASWHHETKEAGVAAVYLNDNDEVIFGVGDRVRADNPMEAEVKALQMGLSQVATGRKISLTVVMDNLMVVDAINGKGFRRTRDTTLALSQQIKQVKDMLDGITSTYIVCHEGRENNSVADGLARSAYSAGKFTLSKI